MKSMTHKEMIVLQVTPRNLDAPGTSRRSLVKGAAWSAPIIVAATATPLAAASSVIPQVDLTSVARIPNESADGVFLGDNFYQGPRTLTFTYTYQNLGPDMMPAGGSIMIDLPFSSVWDANTMTVASDPADKVGSLISTEVYEAVSTDPKLNRTRWTYLLDQPVLAGETFNVTFSVLLNGTSTSATNFYRVRPFSDISVGSSGANDTDTGNNFDPTNSFVYFNNEDAS